MDGFTDSQIASLSAERRRDFKPSEFDIGLQRDKSEVAFAYHRAVIDNVPFCPIFAH